MTGGAGANAKPAPDAKERPGAADSPADRADPASSPESAASSDGPGAPPSPPEFVVPESVRSTLEAYRKGMGIDVHLWQARGEGSAHLYPVDDGTPPRARCHPIPVPLDAALAIEVRGIPEDRAETVAELIGRQVARELEYEREVRFFTYELSERYEEINLLYSISETLGSVLNLEEASRAILGEVCDVLAALRGSLWVFRPGRDVLELVASVGREGPEGPVRIDDPDSVTARVFREGRSMIPAARSSRPGTGPDGSERRRAPRQPESMLSVPIRYTPPTGIPRSVGVINLMGRRGEDRFSASDEKLLSAIASQVGAALENNRLVQKTLEQERVAKELELAHDLQMKLLPSVESFRAAEVGARVQPADSVGGDFYQLYRLPDDRIGIMMGDVSSHGFPAALIMALVMSAAAIYAADNASPSELIGRLAGALGDELESTEMYLTLFYGVLDPGSQTLVYSNAGHPHAFLVRRDGEAERLTATDPPVGIAPGSFGESTIGWSFGDDLLLLFTDGLSDLLGAAHRENGEAMVVSEVCKERDRPVGEIVDRLFELAAEVEPEILSDDRTALVVRA